MRGIGQWYDGKSITKKYVENDMKCHFFINHPRPFGLPTFFKIKEILKIIDKNIDAEYKKYNGFGSMRGYSTFTRNSLILDIKKEIEQKKIELAIEKIKKSKILSLWINNILYRPPDNNSKYVGLRYASVKKSFEDNATLTVKEL